MDLEETFRRSLYTSYGENKCILLPKDKYIKTVGDLLEATQEPKISPRQFYLHKKYEQLQCVDVQKLIRKKPNQEHPLYFATIEETFDIIKRVHIATGHGGRDKMCQRKRKRTTTKGIVVKPILSKDFSSRAQVDLIDMQYMCQGQHKWITVYQNHLTKFYILHPLTSKRAPEIAYQLLDIYLLLGAPSILQSDMLIAWMSDNDTRDWTVGLKFVQFQKNSSHHIGIKRSPFAALVGADAKVGLTSSSLPKMSLQG